MSADGAAATTDRDWAVRAEVYRSFAEACRAPTMTELADAVATDDAGVRASLERLEAAHEIAMLPDGSGVWMANPFSAVETPYPVRFPAGTVWANCAWDALGIPAILGTDGWTTTRCQQSGASLEFGVRDGRREGDDGVIHLVVPPRDAWNDIGFT